MWLQMKLHTSVVFNINHMLLYPETRQRGYSFLKASSLFVDGDGWYSAWSSAFFSVIFGLTLSNGHVHVVGIRDLK